MADYFTQLVVQPEIAAHLLDQKTRERLEVCGLTCAHDQKADTYYIYSEDYASYDDDTVSYEDILQEIVSSSDGELTRLTVEAALTCSQPRPDGFGGYALVITADRIRSMSTSEWLLANK